MVQLWHVFFQMSLEQVMVTVNSDVHNNSTASDNNRRGKAMPFWEYLCYGVKWLDFTQGQT